MTHSIITKKYKSAIIRVISVIRAPLKTVFILLLLYGCSSEKMSNITLFISPSGNDNWSGKLSEPNKNETDGPFATFQKAQETIRELKKTDKLPAAGITVYIREGNYSISKTIKLTSEDSGEKNAPIIWCSYRDEKVVFSGGETISGFTKIKDAEILKRIDKTYHNSILVCDIQKFNPKELIFNSHKPLAMELFFNGEAMTLARYPNKGWLEIIDVPQFGEELIFKGNKFMKENPGFEDNEKEKFQLNDNSPAYELGFKKIPIEKIGLYSDEYRTLMTLITQINTDKK